jgi:hypothetical protein
VGGDSGRDGREGGEEAEREGRARQARDTEKQKMFVRFYRGKFARLPEGMKAPCCPDVIRYIYEEFKVYEVRKV